MPNNLLDTLLIPFQSQGNTTSTLAEVDDKAFARLNLIIAAPTAANANMALTNVLMKSKIK